MTPSVQTDPADSREVQGVRVAITGVDADGRYVQYDVTPALAHAAPETLTAFFDGKVPHSGYLARLRTDPHVGAPTDLGPLEPGQSPSWKIDYFSLDDWLIAHRPLLVAGVMLRILEGLLPADAKVEQAYETILICADGGTGSTMGMPNHRTYLRAIEGVYLLTVVCPAALIGEVRLDPERFAGTALPYARAQLLHRAGVSPQEARKMASAVSDEELRTLVALRHERTT